MIAILCLYGCKLENGQQYLDIILSLCFYFKTIRLFGGEIFGFSFGLLLLFIVLVLHLGFV